MQIGNLLHNRIDLERIPFSDRGTRLMVFRREHKLYIRLTERWFKWEREVGHYRVRAPILDEFEFTDGEGRPLDFELSSEPHAVWFDTRVGRFGLTFLDGETLLFSLPAGCSGMRFVAHAERRRIDRRGGELHGKRNIAYTTDARVLANSAEDAGENLVRVGFTLEAEADQAVLVNVTPRLGYCRSVPPASETIEAARRRWEAWFAAVPDVADEFRPQYAYAWWVMRAGLISSRFYTTREAMTPSKIHYVGVWHWDQFFHALAYRHVDARLAEDQLRIMLDHQLSNGMIPDAVHDEGIVTQLEAPVAGPVTKPPLIAWTALQLVEASGHVDFLSEIYEPLCRWNDWWINENDLDGDGVIAYSHPFSSGLDDSPLWDDGVPVEAPDLNTYLVLQQESMARIAELIGETQDVPMWLERADTLSQKMLEHFWDEDAGMFWGTYQHRPVRVRTPFSLLPLWTGRLPDRIVKRLIGHLTDPNEFWPEYPVPTVAINDPKYNPEQMWRGPTWINVNYLLIRALERIDRHDLAHELRGRTLSLMMRHADIYEYYHPQTGTRPAKAAPLFGWSAAIFIDLALEASRELA